MHKSTKCYLIYHAVHPNGQTASCMAKPRRRFEYLCLEHAETEKYVKFDELWAFSL